MIYYSTEARAYGLMMLAVLLSTLGILLALDTGRTRWWVLYAVSACAAFYLHYTSVFVLARPVRVGPVGPSAGAAAGDTAPALAAAAGVLPWLPGLINDYQSPTARASSALSPFTPFDVRLLPRALGDRLPVSLATARRRSFPGVAAMIAARLVAVARRDRPGCRATGRTLAARDRGARPADRCWSLRWRSRRRSERRWRALVSNSIFSARNLAASWPYLALVGAAVLTATRRSVAVAGDGAGDRRRSRSARSKCSSSRFGRPDYQGAAAYIARNARAGDVVVDVTGVLSPGPLTGLDVALHAAAADLPRRRAGRARAPVRILRPDRAGPGGGRRGGQSRPGTPRIPRDERVRLRRRERESRYAGPSEHLPGVVSPGRRAVISGRRRHGRHGLPGSRRATRWTLIAAPPRPIGVPSRGPPPSTPARAGEARRGAAQRTWSRPRRLRLDACADGDARDGHLPGADGRRDRATHPGTSAGAPSLARA